MKRNLTFILFFALIQLSCESAETQESNEKHIFYLHGRIIEQQGRNAVSETYGSYEFDSIVAALKVENSIVHGDIRQDDVDTKEYAQYLSKQIDSLIKIGVLPTDITVIGASKGAIIGSHLSHLSKQPINYVFMAGNNDYQEEHNEWKFHGQVLCFYDSSDSIAGKNYNYWIKNAKTTKFEQVQLDLNLGHGFLYKPMKEWIDPTKKWIHEQQL